MTVALKLDVKSNIKQFTKGLNYIDKSSTKKYVVLVSFGNSSYNKNCY